MEFSVEAEISTSPSGARGDGYPKNSVPPEYKIGALYGQKDSRGVQKTYQENKEKVADHLRFQRFRSTPIAEAFSGDPLSLVHFKSAFPSLPDAKAKEYFPKALEAMKKWKIHSFERVAEIFGQWGHESGDLNWWKEFGSDSYLKGKSYYPYIGRSPIMLTWKENYNRMEQAIEKPIVKDPDLLLKPEVGFDVACAFFSGVNPQGRDLRSEADNGNFDLIMLTILGAVNHPSYADRWNRYINAGRSLPIPFSLRSGVYMQNFEKGLAYIWNAIGEMPYGWWLSGDVPAGQPAYGENTPPPSVDYLRSRTIFCIGPINLIRRKVGKIVPTAGDARYDGGTVACWAYWHNYMKPWKNSRNLPHGTLIFRKFRNSVDQGHGAIVLGNYKVLQSYDGGEFFEGGTNGPGLNIRSNVDASHGGSYYEYAVMPGDWINHEQGRF